jgi:hypothetical protein
MKHGAKDKKRPVGHLRDEIANFTPLRIEMTVAPWS